MYFAVANQRTTPREISAIRKDGIKIAGCRQDYSGIKVYQMGVASGLSAIIDTVWIMAGRTWCSCRQMATVAAFSGRVFSETVIS